MKPRTFNMMGVEQSSRHPLYVGHDGNAEGHRRQTVGQRVGSTLKIHPGATGRNDVHLPAADSRQRPVHLRSRFHPPERQASSCRTFQCITLVERLPALQGRAHQNAWGHPPAPDEAARAPCRTYAGVEDLLTFWAMHCQRRARSGLEGRAQAARQNSRPWDREAAGLAVKRS